MLTSIIRAPDCGDATLPERLGGLDVWIFWLAEGCSPAADLATMLCLGRRLGKRAGQ